MANAPVPVFLFEEKEDMNAVGVFLEGQAILRKGQASEYVPLPKTPYGRMNALLHRVLRRKNGDLYLEYTDEDSGFTEQVGITAKHCDTWNFQIPAFLEWLGRKLQMDTPAVTDSKNDRIWTLGSTKGVDILLVRDGRDNEESKSLQERSSVMILVPLHHQKGGYPHELSLEELCGFENTEMTVREGLFSLAVDRAFTDLNFLLAGEECEILSYAEKILYFPKQAKILFGREEKVTFSGVENHIFTLILSYSKNKNTGKVAFQELRNKVLQNDGRKYTENTMQKMMSNLKKKLKEAFGEREAIMGDKQGGYFINSIFLS